MAEPWHALGAEEVARSLGTDLERGLTSEEAARRLQQYGPNELREKPPVSFWKRLFDQLNSFVVILLIVASIISALLGDTVEAIVIMAIVVLNAAVGVIQESKAEQALESLKKMAAPEAQVIRDGHRLAVPSRELVPGDIVLLEAGNVVPADLRLLESVNLKIEEASLTGESVPVNKSADQVLDPNAPLGDRKNSAYMGTMVAYGRGKGLVVGTGMNTEIGMIAEMLQAVEEEETPLQRKLDELGRMLGVGALAVCGLVFVVGIGRVVAGLTPIPEGMTFLDEVVELFMIAVSLAIAAVPEGLPAVVTLCLALGMREMVRRHALIRRLTAVETLGSATVICSDKTGTLTQNQMTVQRLWANGIMYEMTGSGYDPRGEVRVEGKNEAITLRSHNILRSVLWAGVLCNDADLEVTGEQEGRTQYRMVGDPTEGALIVAGAKAGYWRKALEAAYPRVAEIPFDAERKRMCTIHALKAVSDDDPSPFRAGDAGYVAIVKGAPDMVLDQCAWILCGKGIIPLTPEKRQEILAANAAMASQALRVLGMAYRPLEAVPAEPSPAEVERDLIFLGLQGMIDPARVEVKPAIQKAREAGLRTIMVTGDYAATAAAIAREIGILRSPLKPDVPGGGRVLSGAELNELSDDQLDALVGEIDVFARVAPQHKVRIVETLKRTGNIVAMTGDGVNDAPALKRADIGVAMGITGTDVSKQAADMVLTDDNYVSIVSAIEQGRIIYSNIRKFVYFLISCNIAEIAIIFIATLLGWPTPLTAIQLLWLNLLSDGGPALALGVEKGDPDIMKRKPRPVNEPVINREMVIGVIVQTIAITSAVLIAYWLGMTRLADTGSEVRTAETMAFVTLVLSELFRAYTSRSERYPILKLGVFSNKWMQLAVGFSILLLIPVLYVPFLQGVFGTVPLTLVEWEIMLPLIFLPSVVAELQKVVINWWEGHKATA